MLKSNVGWSTEENSYNSGKTAAKQAVVDLIKTKVAFLYTSENSDIKEVLEGAKSELGTAPIIGCTSSEGIIVPDGYISSDSKNGFAGILAIGDPELEVGIAAGERGKNPRETGRKIAKEAMEKAGKNTIPSYFYMIASPNEEESYLKGIEDVIGRVPFFGGSAADNEQTGRWKIYTNDKIFSDGVAVAFFYTNKSISNVYTGAYHETTNAGIITGMNGKREITEIDGVPAVARYALWTEKDLSDLAGGNLSHETVLAPLGVKDMLGDLIAIRYPQKGNSDLSMKVGSDLSVNTAVIQMEATVDELIDSTGKTVKELNKKIDGVPGAYLFVHSEGRKQGIGNRIDEVYEQIKKEANGVPFITTFTSGEYGVADHGANTCGGLMLSFTAFGK